MKKINIKKIIIFLLLFISFFLLKSCNVKATTITDYQYQMRYFTYSITDKSDIASESGWTSYHRPSEGYSLVLYGKDDYSPTNDKFQYMSGFDTKINYPINKGVTYTATLVFTFSSISDNEFSSSRLNYFTNSNLVRVSNSAYSYGSVSYSKNDCFNYSSVKYCTYTATVNYSFTAISDASNIALGSWNNNGSGFAFFEHNLTSSFSLNSISIDKNADNTIINQNQTIINQNQGIINNQNKTNEKLDEVNGNITDDNVNVSESSITDNSASVSDSPISDLLVLPVKLLTNISNGLQGTCNSFNLGSLFGTDLILPCINLESRLGSFLWGLIDSLFCIFLVYNVGMLAIKIWTDVIMMKDVFSDLYKPSSEKKGSENK